MRALEDALNSGSDIQVYDLRASRWLNGTEAYDRIADLLDEPDAINEHERTCPDCQRVIALERER